MQAISSFAGRDIAFPSAVKARPFSRPSPVTFYTPEAEIYAQGEKTGSIFRVEYGAVRISRLLADGRRQIIAFHVTGEVFGFESGERRSFFAESLVASGLSTVEIDQDGRYSAELMGVALQHMVRAQEHLLVIGRQHALEKMAVFLLDLATRQGGRDKVDLVMSRTDIGDYLGMTIETVSRSISKLRSLGILRLKNLRCVEILKPDALRHLTQ